METTSWEILPHVGVGILRFGQTRSEIQSHLGPPSKSFKKVPFAEKETDAYNDIGLHFYYDPSDQLESVDAWGPSTIRFQGIALLNIALDLLVEQLAKLGFTHKDLVFEDAGFSLYVIDDVVNGVTVFAKGYNDVTNPNSAVNRVKRALDAWRQTRPR